MVIIAIIMKLTLKHYHWHLEIIPKTGIWAGFEISTGIDIATVAPGIAEALITTLAGIMIAIPALVMFVYLNTMARSLEQACMNLADRFVIVAHRLMHQ